MKPITKALVLMVALVLIAGLALSEAPEAHAAVLILEPKESTTLIIEYSGAWGVDGTIEFSDPGIISKVEFLTENSGMTGLAENGRFFFYTDQPEGANGKIVIRLTLASNAKPGSSTSVTLRYMVTEAGSSTGGDVQLVHTTIMTAQEVVTPPPVVQYLDNSALVAQLRRVQSLTPSDYTLESWNAVEQAVKAGYNALNGGSQSQINNAAYALSEAIDALAPMDYSNLQSVLDSLSVLEGYEEIAVQWARFVTAVNAANDAMTGGDQAVVELAVEELIASKEALLQALEELRPVKEVEKEVEVIVEKVVEKVVTETVYEEDCCTKWWHTAHLITMIISLVINLALGTLVIIYFVKKRRAHRDTTPLVEYDIEADGTPMS